jgi:hypothetical protein
MAELASIIFIMQTKKYRLQKIPVQEEDSGTG